MPETVEIPYVQYIRPNGERKRMTITVPYDQKIADNLDIMRECGIEITMEDIPGGSVNVCLDDGEFDYRFMLFSNDENLNLAVAELVKSFSVEDYKTARREFDDGPDDDDDEIEDD